MKTNKIGKIVMFAAIATFLVVLLSACGGDHPLVGTWEVVETNGLVNRVGDRLILNADGTARDTISGFRWEVNGDYFVTIVPAFGNLYQRFEIDGDHLTIHHDDRGRRSTTFERVQ